MVRSIPLSSIQSPALSTTMDNVFVKQFTRTFSDSFVLNFATIFDNIRDLKTKNYSNFYLSDDVLVDDCFDYGSDILPASNIRTEIKYGESFLQFSDVDKNLYKYAGRFSEVDNYGRATFSSESNGNTHFNLLILEGNVCRVYFTKNYRKYFLISDVDDKVSFVLESLVPTTSDVLASDFSYLFSENSNSLLLFKQTATTSYVLTKFGNTLVLNPNVSDFITTPFTLSRSIFTNIGTSNNTSFIAYNIDNTVEVDNSYFTGHNNLLLHKPVVSSLVSPIVLKNQLLQNDVFSCANTLLSGGVLPEYSDNLREYTSIFEDIQEETTDELELNYVFYNKPYKIVPGSNTFVSPSSMFPYATLNINDSTFIQAGAFSFSTPEFADKVYHLSAPENSQYLLCTWLSGNPTSADKVWVDRYYYPDLIAKEAALQIYGPAAITYNDEVERLIATNSDGLEENVAVRKFFDKKSDLVFTPNETYQYERISTTSFTTLSSSITYCSGFSPVQPINYFKQINNSNKFTVGFYFNGDTTDWTVESERNGIESGLTIVKTGQTLSITYSLFDASTSIINSWTITETVKTLKNNFVLCSVDAVTGDGYFFLNDRIILQFNISSYQFIYKQLLYGDFFIVSNGSKVNLLEATTFVTLPFVVDEYTSPSLAFIKPILDGKTVIDNLYITLPCGMRNSSDNVEYLQNVCGSTLFKSNKINIVVKNTGITNSTILADLETTITNNIAASLPVGTDINDIVFENYK